MTESGAAAPATHEELVSLTGRAFSAVIGHRRAGRPGRLRLRLRRGMAVLRLFVRGGVRYAGSAPRLFAAAGEKREVLRGGGDLCQRI